MEEFNQGLRVIIRIFPRRWDGIKIADIFAFKKIIVFFNIPSQVASIAVLMEGFDAGDDLLAGVIGDKDVCHEF